MTNWTIERHGLSADDCDIEILDGQTKIASVEDDATAQRIVALPDLLAFAIHVLKSGACIGVPGLEGYAHLVISKALGGPIEPSQERASFVRKATGGAE